MIRSVATSNLGEASIQVRKLMTVHTQKTSPDSIILFFMQTFALICPILFNLVQK